MSVFINGNFPKETSFHVTSEPIAIPKDKNFNELDRKIIGIVDKATSPHYKTNLSRSNEDIGMDERNKKLRQKEIREERTKKHAVIHPYFNSVN